MLNILFISHDATRTGAPIALLHLMRWIKQNTNNRITILLKGGGELEEEFKSISTTYFWSYQSKVENVWKARVQRLTKKPTRYRKSIVNSLNSIGFDLIYANTVVASDLAAELKSVLGCPAICHVHELKIMIDQAVGRNRFIVIANTIDYFIAASEAVMNNLSSNYAIPLDKIGKVYEFIPTNEITLEKTYESIKEELSIPQDAFVVGASGTLDWRKSPDLFVQVAHFTKTFYKKQPYFVWVGGGMPREFVNLRYDLERVQLLPYVKFIDSKKNPADYMQIFDVFALTSREDPYPLVCLEAANLAKPILCFNDSGGMPEFVEQDCGFIIPFLRPDLMAERISYLMDNPQEVKKLGYVAKQKVSTQHDVGVAGKQIINYINEIVQQEIKQ